MNSVPLSESDGVHCSATYPMQRFLGGAEKWEGGCSAALGIPLLLLNLSG